MFKNQSMQARLIFAFIFMGILVLIVALVGLSGSSRLSKHIDTLANNSVPSISGLWKINAGQTQIESSERGLLDVNLSKDGRQTEIDRMDNAWKQIQEGFQQYEATPKLNAEKQAYKDFLNKWDAWKDAHEEFLRRNLRFESLGVFNLFENTAGNANLAIAAHKELEKQVEANRQPFTAATVAFLEVLKMNEDLAAETEHVSAKDVSQVGFWAFVAILIGPGTAILFGIFFSNTIARPLGAKIAGVVDIAQKISAGDLTSEISLADQQDEVGQLQNAFYTMNKDLNALVNRIQQSGNQITNSADQITASGRNLEATVTEQVASTNEVTATAHQIAATSRELVKTMEYVAAMAEQTTVAAGNSKDNLNHIDSVMHQLLAATQVISSKLEVMHVRANNISRVVTTITVVADQTNLLSLNAALEAERAGEYGAGFAVVAREIRRLADQTAVATLEIEQMIKEMQSAVSIGVTEMDKFTKSVVHSVEDVDRISEQIAQVIQQVQGLTPRFEQVSQSVDEQSQGAQQISEAMEHLSQASQQTAGSLRETNHALEQLDEATHSLKREIARFKVMA
ncbi:methyl-accepting chemotaxis protein [Nostoc punctiforme]|jgi:methyl-accepting chemotaxis protein WspA|uniref:Methyl-accepting chemotaxis sensory transducer n=1 Tax=Nostoc punctiforme (strain ATCC 29133 / PCC 73102) TaxID=63737 RepID=B2J4R1_NOSP7|nr:methyl-accepting chemotaxis protein [Nostoc punctiforme]ACC79033.1 methyl-accepting chemotaxis sensory transducer [Nostoc punctiforme PCC 73102]